jgi:hypothetical protein
MLAEEGLQDPLAPDSEVFMRKGFTEAIYDFWQWLALVLICFIMIIVIINWSAAGAHVQRGVEQGSLMYTIANSVNALSSMEEGEVIRRLSSNFDIEIDCSDGHCYVMTIPYDSSGKALKESNKVLILGNVEPKTIKNVNKITLTKEMGKKVVLTGEHTDDSFMTPLVIPESTTPRCVTKYPEISTLLYDNEINQGEQPELIAAIIQRESSWNTKSYRYEPGFQVRNLDGSPVWTKKEAWLKTGNTIEQWFALNPNRAGEKSSLTSDQLKLIAQTKLSASYGLMQILVTTAYPVCNGLTVKGTKIDLDSNPEQLYDAKVNLFCGVKYLKSLRARYPDIRDAVSAYNAGKPAWTTNLANRKYTVEVLGYYNDFKACTA